MNYRKAKIRDVKKIQKLAAEQSLYSYPTIVYSTLACAGYLQVIENNGDLIGFICFCPIPFGADAFILQICLNDKHQSKGLGKEILNKLYQRLRKQFKTTQVWAHTLKERSLKFFQRQKWRTMFSIFNVTLIRKTLNPHHRNQDHHPDPKE
jgi:GNAT superfamily N-acetyltransferase